MSTRKYKNVLVFATYSSEPTKPDMYYVFLIQVSKRKLIKIVNQWNHEVIK